MAASDSAQTHRFLQLLGQSERQLRAYVLAMVPHWNDADDIVQQVRIKLWEQFNDYDAAKDFTAWAVKIAYYQVLTYREANSRKRELLVPEFFEAVQQGFSESADALEGRRQALAQCLETLPEPKRALLMRYYSGAETMQAISAALGKSFDSIRHMILRTRKTLAACIESTAIEEERP